MEKKVLAIISGGLDSTTMLWHLQSSGYEIMEAISFDYGQRHKRELEKIPEIITRFNSHFGKNITHSVISLDFMQTLAAKGALVGDEEVPKTAYDVESQKSTVVPNRNGIFLNIAAARAVTMGYRYVAYAAHSSDSSVYPDCRPEYVDVMSRALEIGNEWDPVGIVAPFLDSTKADIAAKGIELQAPLELTWSCYEGGTTPCLECGTCHERILAFHKTGTPDPALSESMWKKALEIHNL